MDNSNQARLDKLMALPFVFPSESAPGSPIVMSSRVRLARNLQKYHFPMLALPDVATEVSNQIRMAVEHSGVMGPGVIPLEMISLGFVERAVLLAHQLAGPEMVRFPNEQQLYIAADGRSSIIVNDEDHIHIQTLLCGMQLRRAWEKVNEFDDLLCGELDIAYDREWGYLTSSPFNVGTGMRASVMMHLAALRMTGQMEQVERALDKLGFTVRGMCGKKSESCGGIYQISNRSTLGENEEDIIERVARMADMLIELEEKARRSLLTGGRNQLLDKVGRSFGMLRYGYTLPETEAFDCISVLRLGVELKVLDFLDMQSIDELYNLVHSGVVAYHAGRELNNDECDVLRAKAVREHLRRCDKR